MHTADLDVEALKRHAASILTMVPGTSGDSVRVFSALREVAPVQYFDALEGYVVTGREQVAQVLGDTETFSSATNANAETSRNFAEMLSRVEAMRADICPSETDRRGGELYPKVPPHSDPPKHSRQRRLLLPSFSTRKARAAEPVLEGFANALIDNWIADGRVEIRRQYADPLMIRFVLQELHCSAEDVDKLVNWVGLLIQLQGSRLSNVELDSISEARVAFDEYFLAGIDEVRSDPTDDVLSKLVHAEVDGDGFSTGELLMLCQTLLVGGTETSSTTTSNALIHLAQHPELVDRLRSDETLLPSFVEETLRLNGPINILFRHATREITLGGVTLPKGARVGVHLGAAGRDPSRCPVPDSYELGRVQPPQLMFGSGPHFCAGAELARIQVRVAIRALIRRLDNISLDTSPDLVEFYPQINLQRVKEVPLRFRRIA